MDDNEPEEPADKDLGVAYVQALDSAAGEAVLRDLEKFAQGPVLSLDAMHEASPAYLPYLEGRRSVVAHIRRFVRTYREWMERQKKLRDGGENE